MTLNKLFRNNRLATPAHLEVTGLLLDGIPTALEGSIRFVGCKLIQQAGVLLRLRQDVIARAIIVFSKFWLGQHGGSLQHHGIADLAAGSLLLTTKLSSIPKAPRAISRTVGFLAARLREGAANDVSSESTTSTSFQELFTNMFKAELVILRALGFHVHVDTPYTIAINFMQTLEVFQDAHGQKLAKRVFALLNEALFSPQLLPITHQPHQIAAAAIYLAAKYEGFKLPRVNWWEVFDVDREELGFLVAAMNSFRDWAVQEQGKWKFQAVPLTIDDIAGISEAHHASLNSSQELKL